MQLWHASLTLISAELMIKWEMNKPTNRENSVAVVNDLTSRVPASDKRTSFHLKICLTTFSMELIYHVATGVHPGGDNTNNINIEHTNRKT